MHVFAKQRRLQADLASLLAASSAIAVPLAASTDVSREALRGKLEEIKKVRNKYIDEAKLQDRNRCMQNKFRKKGMQSQVDRDTKAHRDWENGRIGSKKQE